MIAWRRARSTALILCAVTACWAPIWFMLVVASHDSAAATTFPPPLLPGADLWTNARSVLEAVSLGRSLVNSAIVSGCIALGGAFVCALAGFAFAKLRFRGRTTLFVLVMAGLTLPVQFAVIPNYLLVSALGWVDSLAALVVPGLASAFGVFWMRQHISATLPDDVIDAAALDGCGPWRTFRYVAFPLVRPGATVLAGLLFVSSWSDFMWPFIVLRSPGSHTVQVALRGLQGEFGVDYSLVFTGALLATLPMLAALIAGGRWATRRLAPSTPAPSAEDAAGDRSAAAPPGGSDREASRLRDVRPPPAAPRPR